MNLVRQNINPHLAETDARRRTGTAMGWKLLLQLYVLALLAAISILPLPAGFAALVFVAIAVMTTVITASKRTTLPLFAYVAFAYVLAFPLVIAFPSYYPGIYSRVSPGALEHGMLWATRGLAALALSYAVVSLKLAFRAPLPVDRGSRISTEQRTYNRYFVSVTGLLALGAWLISTTLFGVSLTFIESSQKMMAAQGSGTLVQLLNLLGSLRYPFFLGVLVLALTHNMSKPIWTLAILLLLVSVFEIVTIGSKATIISGLAIATMALSYLRLRISGRHLINGLVVLIGLYFSFAVITEYRSIMQSESTAGADVFSVSVQFHAFSEALDNVLPFVERSASSDRLTQIDSTDILSRFGAATMSFSNLLDHTGRESPFENAIETFLVPLYSVAPRVIVPNKPEFFHSGRNATEYYGWDYGGISVTLPGSLYFSWGYAGVILGMGFVGGLMAWMWKKSVVGAGAFMPWLILSASFTVILLDVGQTFHAGMTNLFRLAILLYLLHRAYPYVRNIQVGVSQRSSF